MSPHLTAAFTEVNQDSRAPKAAPTHLDMLKSKSKHPSHMSLQPRLLTSASTCATVSRGRVFCTSKRLHTSGRTVCGTRCTMRRIVKHAVVTVVPSCSVRQPVFWQIKTAP